MGGKKEIFFEKNPKSECIFAFTCIWLAYDDDLLPGPYGILVDFDARAPVFQVIGDSDSLARELQAVGIVQDARDVMEQDSRFRKVRNGNDIVLDFFSRLLLLLAPYADKALVLAGGKPERGPDEDEVADEASPGFGLVLGAFEFEAAAGDAEVVPQSPSERDDEAHEHPEDGERRFADERG